ncbi:MAG: phage major capsid protein [Eubacteriales bacterium]|nr:phage major capsid protein [Eubacteriales bacterium]
MAIFEKISLEKGMYAQSGKSMTDILEELDPSTNYVGTELEGLDAFSRQLKRFDIKVSGRKSDPVEKFFQTTDSAALFPEYVSRAVRQGMEEADVLSDIIATKTSINGMDYRSITSTPNDEDKSLVRVSEGAYIPQTKVSTQENLVKLHKRGRMLVSSYEALRFQRLDLFTVMLKQIGAYIARAQLKDAVQVLINGDGNGNPCGEIATSAKGAITYDDMVKLWAELSPYELNTIVAPTDAMCKLLSISEFKDSNSKLDFHATGRMITPLGAKLIHTTAMDSGTVIGIDKSCALEMVQAGDIVTDYDKLIDRQLERATISCIAGFAKIFPDASKKLTY